MLLSIGSLDLSYWKRQNAIIVNTGDGLELGRLFLDYMTDALIQT